MLLERRKRVEKLKTKHGSKNRNGGFHQLHVDNKEVSIFKNPSAGQRCLLSLLDLYLSKIPEKAKKLIVSTVDLLRSSVIMVLGIQYNQEANTC